MKRLFNILLLLPAFCLAQKRIVLPVGTDSAIYQIDVMYKLKVLPGDTLVVPDKPIKCMKLRRFWGTAEKPIVITWANPKRAIGGYGAYAVSIESAAFFILTNFYVHGKGNSNSGVAVGWDVHDFEVSYGIARNIFGAGFKIKTDPLQTDTTITLWPNTIYNVKLQNLLADSCGNEGFYIGNTGTSGLKAGQAPVALVNLSADSLVAVHCGWDGIQFSHILGLKIGKMCVFDFGKKNQPSQQSGVEIGSSVTLAAPVGLIRASKGTGAGLKVFGKGQMLFDSIQLTNTGTTTGESGMYIDDFSDPHYSVTAPQAITINSLKVSGASKAPLYYANRLHTALPIVVKAFSFLNILSPVFDATNGTFGPVEVKPVDTVVKKPVDTVVVIVTPPVDTVIVVKPPVDTVVIVVKPDTVVTPKNDTAYKSIAADYTLPTTPLQVLTWTAKTGGKVYMPAKPVDGQYVKLLNPNMASVRLGSRWYFTNGKYRLAVGRMMAAKYKLSKNKWYIVERMDK